MCTIRRIFLKYKPVSCVDIKRNRIKCILSFKFKNKNIFDIHSFNTRPRRVDLSFYFLTFKTVLMSGNIFILLSFMESFKYTTANISRISRIYYSNETFELICYLARLTHTFLKLPCSQVILHIPKNLSVC